MTNDEIKGRLLVLETFTMTTLGLYLASLSDDANVERAKAILSYLRGVSRSLADDVSDGTRAVVESYSDHLAGLVSDNLRILRGESRSMNTSVGKSRN